MVHIIRIKDVPIKDREKEFRLRVDDLKTKYSFLAGAQENSTAASLDILLSTEQVKALQIEVKNQVISILSSEVDEHSVGFAFKTLS